ncbi:uncharacterized protein LOC111322060 [Stylophora pistillata]|uniref:uncharacterized protein LOC111322060 n=1 Tax=Stylophora pistillata TaxID=50429 RepID=UPI000C053982|nr:uncharacterized protein LOC111322060 [Stylophora pistillata]
MYVSRARETPSVVSTRVLKTHRMNSVEIFRLQERVKTIDYESQHNYSQISDEIDGVRQNLVKIKGVKKNVGVSVERRKFLRDKGLRILPSKVKGDAEYFTVRSSCGKDINIPCSDFYDGDALRKQLSIDKLKSLPSPNLDTENSDNEKLTDRSSAGTWGRSQSLWKDFRYRNITPPLRSGSRRNFRDVEEENCKDKEKLLSLDEIGNKERKYGILRPQTAHLKRDKDMVLLPRSRTCPGNIQENKGSTPRRKISRKSSSATGNVKKKSQGSDSVTSEKKTDEKSAELQLESGLGTEPNFLSGESSDKIVLEETISLDLKPSLRPKIRPRSMNVASLTGKKGISGTVADLIRMSLESSASTDHLPPTPSNGNRFQSKSPETSPRVPKNSVATANHDVKEDNYEPDGDQRRLSKLSERKISWKDSVHDAGDKGDDKITRGKLSDASLPSIAGLRKPRTNGVQSTATRAQSAPQGRPGLSRQQNSTLKKVSKINGRRNSAGDFVYDARPDKALSKGYMTMQMTIGGKQVRVYVPKFSTSECIDDVTPTERSRAKAALQAAGAPGKKLSAKNK